MDLPTWVITVLAAVGFISAILIIAYAARWALDFLIIIPSNWVEIAKKIDSKLPVRRWPLVDSLRDTLILLGNLSTACIYRQKLGMDVKKARLSLHKELDTELAQHGAFEYKKSFIGDFNEPDLFRLEFPEPALIGMPSLYYAIVRVDECGKDDTTVSLLFIAKDQRIYQILLVCIAATLFYTLDLVSAGISLGVLIYVYLFFGSLEKFGYFTHLNKIFNTQKP